MSYFLQNYKKSLTEGLAGMVDILLATLFLANIAKITINMAITRGKMSSSYNPKGLIFARRFIVIFFYIFGLGLALAKIPEFKIVGHSLWLVQG